MPTMPGAREYAEAGGLTSYGLILPAVFHRAADFVDKVFRGVKPADIPIGQPMEHELFINFRTAKALGVIVPDSLLAGADESIQ